MAHSPGTDIPVRVAIISTPRSGNTWLRGMLAHAYGMRELPLFTPDDINWETLPPRCAVQIHWPPTDAFRGLLTQHGFRVITLARHPLDVFLSALNYLYHVHSRARCSGGPDCDPCSLMGAIPTNSAFRDYCCGPLGEALLALSVAWWNQPGVIRLRYEDLVRDTSTELARIVAALEVPPGVPLEKAIAVNSMEGLRKTYREVSYHFWQGRPDHWRTLLPAEIARAIAEANRTTFETFGYTCNPDETLNAASARERWHAIRLQGIAIQHGPESIAHDAVRQVLCQAWDHLAEAVDDLAAARRSAQNLAAAPPSFLRRLAQFTRRSGVGNARRTVRADTPAPR